MWFSDHFGEVSTDGWLVFQCSYTLPQGGDSLPSCVLCLTKYTGSHWRMGTNLHKDNVCGATPVVL